MSRRLGFTLIELLVVIAIVSLLVSILLPSLRQAKEQARAVVCQTNMRGIHSALHMYAEDWDGCIMMVQGGQRTVDVRDTSTALHRPVRPPDTGQVGREVPCS